MCVKVEHFIKIYLWYGGFETNSQWDVTGINYSPLSMRTEQGALWVWSVTVTIHNKVMKIPPAGFCHEASCQRRI